MNNFNEAMFKTKVDNVFVKLYTAIILRDLSTVKHFISDKLYNKYQAYVDSLIKNKEIQMYDELNVKSTQIINKYEQEDKYIIEVLLVSRYMDYVIDEDSANLSRGNNTSRIEKNNKLIFIKNKNTKNANIVRKCPGCGASISVNTSGKCSYCGAIYNLEDYDFILDDLITN